MKKTAAKRVGKADKLKNMEEWYLPKTEDGIERLLLQSIAKLQQSVAKVEAAVNVANEEIVNVAKRAAGEALAACADETAFASFRDGKLLVELPIGEEFASPEWEVSLSFAVDGVVGDVQDIFFDAEDAEARLANAKALRDQFVRFANHLSIAINKAETGRVEPPN